VAGALAASGTFEQLMTYTVFSGWIFYGLGALAVFAFRRAAPNAERPFVAFGAPMFLIWRARAGSCPPRRGHRASASRFTTKGVAVDSSHLDRSDA